MEWGATRAISRGSTAGQPMLGCCLPMLGCIVNSDGNRVPDGADPTPPLRRDEIGWLGERGDRTWNSIQDYSVGTVR
jgi:hypothetical protein